MRKCTTAVALLLSLVACWQSAAKADPIIAYSSPAQFLGGITAGFLEGVTTTGIDQRNLDNLHALDFTYGLNQIIGDTRLDVSNDISAGEGGLVSQTSAAQTTPTIGAWSHKGPDPDYTNFTMDFTLFFPQVGVGAGIDTMSLAIIDIAGLVKYWQWDSTVLFPGLQRFQVNLSGNVGEGGSTSSAQEPGFDLTQSAIVQLSYRGTVTGAFPGVPGDVPPLNPPGLWLGTTDFATVPEPGALAVFGAGLVGFAALRKRRRTRGNLM
jgi:hypothetical protein